MQQQVKEMGQAIREHWTVENRHQIRDVTFKEDEFRTKFDPISQLFAIARTIAIEVIRKFSFKSYAEATERFANNIDSLFAHLISANFL